MIAAVGLAGKENRYPRELSGGQEQRVAIARALVKQPLVILADEPTANLDSHTAEEIVELMRGINVERGSTFVFSTHDRLVMDHARRVVTIRDGKRHGGRAKRPPSAEETSHGHPLEDRASQHHPPRPRRTIITAVVMMVGIAVFIFFDSMLAGLDRMAIDNMDGLHPVLPEDPHPGLRR